MAPLREPTHFTNFTANLKEVDRLSDIHTLVTPDGPGRKYHVQVLHKSGIVLLVACWEAFVEDLASGGLKFLLSGSTTPEKLPESVRKRVADKHPGLKAWELAGSGWKLACTAHLQEVLARTTGALNTPKTAQVDELFDKVIGFSNLSSHWYWQGRSTAQCEAALDDLVMLRGSIAHRVSTARGVQKGDVFNARELLARLAVKSHNAVNRHLEKLVGTAPWEGFWYSETR